MKLINRIVQSFAPTQEAGPERQRIANTLAFVIPYVIVFYPAFQILARVKGEPVFVQTFSLIFFIIMMPVFALCYYYSRQRAYMHSSYLLIIGLWVIITFNIFVRGSIQLQIYDIYYILILLAGYLLPLRHSVWFISSIFLVTLFLWWAEFLPWVTYAGYPPTRLVVVLLKMLNLSTIGLFSTIATRHIRIILTNLQRITIKVEEKQIQLAKANDSLKEQSNLLQTIIDNLPGRITYVDKNGRVVFMNQQYANIGIDPSDSIGMMIVDAMSEKQTEILKPFMQEAFAGKKVSWEMPFPVLDETRIITASYIPHIVNNKVQGFISLTKDVTEERKTEKAMQQAQKLHSLGLLAGGIAHDFNNLLSAIMGQSSLALLKMDNQHPAHRHIAKVVDASERAAMLIQQMLAYSGRGQFQVRYLNLNEFIHANVELFQVSIPKHIQLWTHYNELLPLIEADAGQIQQVVMNLILNAAQAIGEAQGVIELTTDVQTIAENDVAYRQYTGESLPPGRYVTVSIQDDGCGMDEETAVQIFDPFFTTKESGSGLGLAAVLGIVRGHNGSIQVYSELEKGTIFKLLLPVATQPDDAQIESKQEEEETAVSPTGSILIIDDETAVCEAAADILNTEGWHTYIANSGEEGLTLYQQHQAKIQIILLDLSMPGIDGHETFQKVRKINPEAQVILTSGYDKNKATQRFTGHKLTGFIQKPYRAKDLIQLINQYV